MTFIGRHDDPITEAPVYTERVKGPGYSASNYQVFGSVAEVMAAIAVKADTILVSGVGEFRWSPASTATHDGLSVIQITGVTTKSTPSASVSLGTSTQVDVLAVVLTGLATGTTYACTVGARATVWATATPTACGNLDCTVDLCVTTSAAGTVTCSFQQTPSFDATRVASAISATTATLSASTGGFTMSATPPAGIECNAKGKVWIDALEVVS